MTWRNRIIALEEHKPADLLDHPLQFKQHPLKQSRVLTGILSDIGKADALLAYKSKRAKGRLVKIDGHGRAGLDPNETWPVLILDLSDEEADYMIGLLDKTADLSVTDDDLFARALESIRSGDTAVNLLIGEMMGELDITALSDDDDGGDGGNNGKSERRGGTPNLIRVAITTEQVALLEKVLRATGKQNRGDALTDVCREYAELRGIDG